MQKQFYFDYYYNFINYHVVLTYRSRMRNINYRYEVETSTFKIHAPFLTSKKTILRYLDELAPKLIKKAEKKTAPISNNAIYLFGHKLPIVISNRNYLDVDKVEIIDKNGLDSLLKFALKEYLKEKVSYFEKEMNIEKPYKISIKNAKTIYGSNRRNTHSLSFALSLVHFHPHVIDSVVIHELAHDLHFDHSPAFYECVNRFCLDYKNCRKALLSNNFIYGNNNH